MYTNMTIKFRQFYAMALPYTQLWRTILVALISFVAMLGGFFIIGVVSEATKSYNLMNEVINWTNSRGVFIAFMIPSFTIIALAILLPLIHKRSIFSLISLNGRVNWSYFFRAVIVFLALTFTIELVFYVVDPSSFDSTTREVALKSWLLWFIPLSFAIFLQTTSEELLFRGYLQQQLAARFNGKRLYWMIIPSVIFGLLHYNPNIIGVNFGLLMVLTTTIMGLIAADLTARTGNLSAAMGFHFINNFWVIQINSNSLEPTPTSLWLTEIDFTNQYEIYRYAILYLIFMCIAYLVILHFWYKKR